MPYDAQGRWIEENEWEQMMREQAAQRVGAFSRYNAAPPSLYPNQAAPYGSFPYADPTPAIWDTSPERVRQDVEPQYRQPWMFNQEPIADTSAISDIPFVSGIVRRGPGGRKGKRVAMTPDQVAERDANRQRVADQQLKREIQRIDKIDKAASPVQSKSSASAVKRGDTSLQQADDVRRKAQAAIERQTRVGGTKLPGVLALADVVGDLTRPKGEKQTGIGYLGEQLVDTLESGRQRAAEVAEIEPYTGMGDAPDLMSTGHPGMLGAAEYDYTDPAVSPLASQSYSGDSIHPELLAAQIAANVALGGPKNIVHASTSKPPGVDFDPSRMSTQADKVRDEVRQLKGQPRVVFDTTAKNLRFGPQETWGATPRMNPVINTYPGAMYQQGGALKPRSQVFGNKVVMSVDEANKLSPATSKSLLGPVKATLGNVGRLVTGIPGLAAQALAYSPNAGDISDVTGYTVDEMRAMGMNVPLQPDELQAQFDETRLSELQALDALNAAHAQSVLASDVTQQPAYTGGDPTIPGLNVSSALADPNISVQATIDAQMAREMAARELQAEQARVNEISMGRVASHPGQGGHIGGPTDPDITIPEMLARQDERQQAMPTQSDLAGITQQNVINAQMVEEATNRQRQEQAAIDAHIAASVMAPRQDAMPAAPAGPTPAEIAAQVAAAEQAHRDQQASARQALREFYQSRDYQEGGMTAEEAGLIEMATEVDTFGTIAEQGGGYQGGYADMGGFEGYR